MKMIPGHTFRGAQPRQAEEAHGRGGNRALTGRVLLASWGGSGNVASDPTMIPFIPAAFSFDPVGDLGSCD